MISLQQLASLDYYLWLGAGGAAARALSIDQSTVSRQLRHTLHTLNLKLNRFGPSHITVQGDSTLLLAERRVHQLARLRGMAPLRLAATYSAGPWFRPCLPPGWITGNFDLPGQQLPLQLLEERVIDAWIGSYQPDLPAPDHPVFLVVDLLRWPVHLLAARDHPLAAERNLHPSDLARFPSLALPSGWFPRTEAHLRAQQLWADPVRIERYDPANWEGRTADGVTMFYGSSFTEAMNPTTIRLDWNLRHVSGDALVVRRDLGNEARIEQLLMQLITRANQLSLRFADVDRVQ
ncbi:MAG: LysR substrate-binding domain-containing protein [Cyanobacteriota bacterium]|nr:LysR substrate-binding domain-containing protein [Cyanobacteriota bacterium]